MPENKSNTKEYHGFFLWCGKTFQIAYFVLELTTTACWNIFHEVSFLLPASCCSLLFHIPSKPLSLGRITCDFHHFCVWCNWISKLHSHKSDGGHRMFSIRTSRQTWGIHISFLQASREKKRTMLDYQLEYWTATGHPTKKILLSIYFFCPKSFWTGFVITKIFFLLIIYPR